MKGKRHLYRFVKRLFDIVISALMCILIVPIIVVVGVLIKIDSEGSIFYSQERVGENGKIFKIYKFRSMYKGAEEELDKLSVFNEKVGNTFKMKNDPRVTRVGKVIRKLSVDELPQFFNVLLGDMSIVGPRPATVSEVGKYSEEERQRLKTKQGITCLWQVYARQDPRFSKQVELDLEYIEKQSIFLDLRIILMTIPSVVKEVILDARRANISDNANIQLREIFKR